MISAIKEFTDNIFSMAASCGDSPREIFFDQVSEMLIEAGDRPFHNNGINHRNRAIPLVEWYKPKSLRRA